MIRKFLLAALIALAPVVAYGQSSPNLIKGQVPTAGQWNSYFTGKQDTLGFTPVNRAGDTMQGPLITVAPSTSSAGLNLPPGNAPTTPNNGDLWVTSSGLFAHAAGVTIGPFATPLSTAGGDLSGTYPNPTVAKVNGVAYSASPSTNTVAVVTGTNATTYEAIPNAALANAATTVNGQTCSLGSTCTISATAGTITVGTTTVASGTSGRILFDNSGVLGEIIPTGTGSVVLASGPSIANLTATGSFTATGLVTNADLANSSMTIAGHSVSLGGTQAIACGDLSNGAASCSTDTTNAGNITSGLLAVAQGGTHLASGTSGGVLYYSATGTLASSAVLTANQLVIGGGAGVAPAALGSAGTTSTVLHGNAGGAPSFGAIVSADLNITGTTCTNQFVTAVSSAVAGTCTTDTLAGAQHANQGTTTTVLHGSAAGNPAWGAVNVGTDVTGTLGIGNGGTGQTTAAGALGPSGFNVWSIATNGDSDYSIPSTARTAETSASLTAVRTWTLPAASSFIAGQPLDVRDAFGGVNGANTITVQRAGSDTINGASSVAITTQYGGIAFKSDGVSSWSYVPSSGGGGGGVSSVTIAAGTGIGVGGTCAITTSGTCTVSLSSPVATANGGTNLTGFTAANNAIYSTSSSVLTAGTLPVAAGGTGATSLAANNVLLGNGTSALQVVAPSTTRNILASNGTTWVAQQQITLGTSVASTSGTAIDFTSIPVGVHRVTMELVGVSTNGTSNPIFQIGDSGGVEATGYLGTAGVTVVSSVASANFTTGVGVNSGAAANVLHGTITCQLVDASTQTWMITYQLGQSNSAAIYYGAFSKALSPGPLDRARLTTVSGTDAFDAGSVNISYE